MQLRLLVIPGVLLVLSLLVCCQSASKVTFQDGGSEQQAEKQGIIFPFKFIYTRANKFYLIILLIILLTKLFIYNHRNFYICIYF